jgi:ATP synthase protein I
VLTRATKPAALATLLAGLVAVVVAWLAVGAHGPLSAVLGTAIPLAFFGLGAAPLALAERTGPGLAWIVLALGYVLRIMVGVVVYAVAVSSDAIDRSVVGLTVIGCALVWLNTALVWSLQKRNRPTLDL